MPDLEIRAATAADAERVAEMQFGAPGPELVGMFGSEERARRFGLGQARRDGVTNPTKPVLVACRDGAIVGMLQYWWPAESVGVELADAKLALQVLGPIRIFGLLPKLRTRARVDHPIPPGAFYIAELYVDRSLRGGGIGSALLDAAEGEARRVGAPQIVLTTTTTNPARRLYERKGFAVEDTRTDPAYERLSGAPGRIFMTRNLIGSE